MSLCPDCEGLFQPQFLVDCLTAKTVRERHERVDHLLHLYDRTALLLRYADQQGVLNQVAARLQEKKVHQNKRTVGGSTAGLVSGALGVAAVASIWTPAGPPLLLASVLCGTRYV